MKAEEQYSVRIYSTPACSWCFPDSHTKSRGRTQRTSVSVSVCTCVHVCVDRGWLSGGFLYFSPPCILRHGLSVNLELINWLRTLLSLCLPFSEPWITGICHHSWIFMWVMKTHKQRTLLTEASPQPRNQGSLIPPFLKTPKVQDWDQKGKTMIPWDLRALDNKSGTFRC